MCSWDAHKRRRAFSLIELLVVVAIIGILAALLLPVLARAKDNARRAQCLSNLKQVNLAVRMYADDHGDTLPSIANATFTAIMTNHFAVFYKGLVRSYAGAAGDSSAADRVFTCPADVYYYDFPSMTYEGKSLYGQAESDFSSYGFNGGNLDTNPPPPAFAESAYAGIAGWKQNAIRNPTKTVLVSEMSALFPWSWHQRGKVPPGVFGVNDAQNVLSLADGHASYVKMFWNPNVNGTACCYNPPAGYDYQWSGE